MAGVERFLTFIYENYVSIIVCIGLIVGIIRKTIGFMNKSDEEKIEIAKAQIQQTMLKLITEAEICYDDWNEAGSIKRSQVIEQIYENYPILSKAVDQEALIEWIDETINESLKTLRKIISVNTTTDTSETLVYGTSVTLM